MRFPESIPVKGRPHRILLFTPKFQNRFQMRIVDLHHRIVQNQAIINRVLKHHTHNQMNLTDPGLIGVHRIEIGVYPANVVLIHQSDRLLPNEGMDECIQEVIVL